MATDKQPTTTRRCRQCGVLDNPRVDVLGEGMAREVFTEHTVTLQLRYMDRAQDQPNELGIDPPHILKMLRTGWERVKVAGTGRKAMSRWVCVNCINANDMFEGIWRELKQNALALEKAQKLDEWREYWNAILDVE